MRAVQSIHRPNAPISVPSALWMSHFGINQLAPLPQRALSLLSSQLLNRAGVFLLRILGVLPSPLKWVQKPGIAFYRQVQPEWLLRKLGVLPSHPIATHGGQTFKYTKEGLDLGV